jgi:hypothetical protein
MSEIYTTVLNLLESINSKLDYLKPSTTVIRGNLTLDGTKQQISINTICKTVTIQAHPDNGDPVYVGDHRVSSTKYMFILSGGSSVTLQISNLNLLYVRGTANDKISYGGEA